MRLTFAEVVLYKPGDVVAKFVGEANLLQRVAVSALLTGALPARVGTLPRTRRIDLVQQINFHLDTPPSHLSDN